MYIQPALSILIAFALSLMLVGCNGDNGNDNDNDNKVTANMACPRIAWPVCGLVAEGDQFQYQTFSNSCVASAEHAHVSFEGECETLEGSLTQAPQPIIIHNDIDNLPEAASSLTLIDSEINQHIATITLEHSGGCGSHSIELHIAPPFMESWPLQIQASLTHESDDTCEALITSTINVDLLPLKKLYHSYYQGDSGQVMIQQLGLYSF